MVSIVLLSAMFSRDVAFLALGQIAMAVGSAVLPALPTLLSHISTGLIQPATSANASYNAQNAARKKKKFTATVRPSE